MGLHCFGGLTLSSGASLRKGPFPLLVSVRALRIHPPSSACLTRCLPATASPECGPASFSPALWPQARFLSLRRGRPSPPSLRPLRAGLLPVIPGPPATDGADGATPAPPSTTSSKVTAEGSSGPGWRCRETLNPPASWSSLNYRTVSPEDSGPRGPTGQLANNQRQDS